MKFFVKEIDKNGVFLIMKVLYLRAGAPAYESRVMKEITFLVKNGYTVEVLAWDRKKSGKRRVEYLQVMEQRIKVTFICIKAPWETGGRKLFVPILRYIICQFLYLLKEGKRYKIIHAADFETIIPAILYKQISKIKVIYDMFDYYADNHNLKGILRKAVIRVDSSMMAMSDRLLICSEKRMEQIGRVPEEKVTVIHNSPPMYRDMKRRTERYGQPRLVYFGSLSSGRYIEELLKVMEHHPDWSLQIGGVGPLAEMVSGSSERCSNIKFYGQLGYNEVLNYEEQASFITALYDPHEPNHKYAAPNKFYEALMLGKPVVMIKGTGMSDIVQGEEIGYVIDLEKEGLEKGLEHAVQIFGKDVGNSEKLSFRMMEIYSKFYSWEQMEQRLKQVYEKLCEDYK